MKVVIYAFLKNLLSVLLCTVVFSLLILFVILASQNNSTVFFILASLFAYVLTLLMVIVYYRYWNKKISQLVLPISFIFLPIVLFFVLNAMRLIVHVGSCPAGWEMFALAFAIIYSMPFFILTCVISLIHIFKARNYGTI